jgi:hypothetical protein
MEARVGWVEGGVGGGEFLDHTRLLLQDSKPLPIDLNLSAW